MKTTLFSPSSWLRKHSKQDQPEQLPVSRSPTPTRSFNSSTVRHRPTGPSSPEGSSRKGYALSRSRASPSRPPRPPSLDLSNPPTHNPTTRAPDSAPVLRESRPRRPPPQSLSESSTGSLPRAKRSMPELDGVWKGFLADVDEDFSSLYKHPLPKSPPVYKQTLPDHSKSVESNSRSGRGLGKPRPTLQSSQSTHNLATKREESPRSSTSSADSLPLAADFASLFPAPPPLSIRKKFVKPLVLHPRPSTGSLRSFDFSSSTESTPVVTPTTPTFRQIQIPSSPLRKSPSAVLLPSSPVSPYSTGFPTPPVDHNPYSANAFPSRSTRMLHSISTATPGSLPMSQIAHRSTSSDTTLIPNSDPSRTHPLPSASRRPRLDKPLPDLVVSACQFFYACFFS